jgi:hypothetical protein
MSPNYVLTFLSICPQFWIPDFPQSHHTARISFKISFSWYLGLAFTALILLAAG